MKKYLLIVLSVISFYGNAQSGKITGSVTDELNNEPLPFAAVSIEGTEFSSLTDLDGKYTISDIPPGTYNVKAEFIGYNNKTIYEVVVNPSRPATVDIKMSTAKQQLNEVVLVAETNFEKNIESPVSLKKIGVNEIQRNPGANQDISKVVQSLPGVASSVAFRNDLIVRGGAPSENKFFIDGIEIPAINHFATQGSTGGPVGMINVNTIKDVDFFTGAFPSNRGNSLSSVMDINLKNGRTDKLGGLFQVGASEIGLFLEGPLGKRTTFMVSARRSYLQFLFELIELPFLPTYNDFQFKVTHKINQRNQITVLGLGAIDNFALNLKANETQEQQYLLANLVDNDQWNYSVGAKYTRFRDKGFTNFILSRFMWNNTAVKYRDNDPTQEQLLDYNSQEIANKFRVEDNVKTGNWRFVYGAGLDQSIYSTYTLDKRLPNNQVLNYSSNLNLLSYSFFGNASTTILNDQVSLALGLRTDAVNFSSTTNNPLEQISPRISASYYINTELSFNANWGIYYQLPPYTTLGFRDEDGSLINEDLRYIRSEHFVAGFAYLLDFNARLSVEGFYKRYSQYPFLFPEEVSLANLGSDFEVVGNRPATSTNSGITRGIEISYEQKLFKGFYGIGSVTFVRSEFEDKNGELIPSSWDNQFIATITAGKKFKKNWEIGFRYQYLGGAPFTPYDLDASSKKENWDNLNRGILNYNRLNTRRLADFSGLNLRIDKKWYFKSISIDVYLDIQNVFDNTVSGQPFLDVQKDADGNPIENPDDDSRYLMTTIPNTSGSRLPTIGVIVEF